MAKRKHVAGRPTAAARGFYLERTETVRKRVTYWVHAGSAEEALDAAASGKASYVGQEELGVDDVSDFSVVRDSG